MNTRRIVGGRSGSGLERKGGKDVERNLVQDGLMDGGMDGSGEGMELVS